MLPNFIGIGAPKAGTTWLFRCLQEHPAVFLAPVKETKFFDEEIIEGRLSDYEAHFQRADGASAVGEISVRYLASHRAPARIHELLPHVKLFVSLRNPIEQVYSHYWHLRRQNFHNWNAAQLPDSFEEALDKYEQTLVDPAFYSTHLRRWLNDFDPSQLHIILYDDIREQPRQVLADLFAFLGVDPAFQPPSVNATGSSVRRGQSPRSRLLGRVHAVLYDQLNRRIYDPLKYLVGSWTADRIKETLKVREILALPFLRQGYPDMSADTRSSLQARFAEDIQQLQALTGRDLGTWT